MDVPSPFSLRCLVPGQEMGVLLTCVSAMSAAALLFWPGRARQGSLPSLLALPGNASLMVLPGDRMFHRPVILHGWWRHSVRMDGYHLHLLWLAPSQQKKSFCCSERDANGVVPCKGSDQFLAGLQERHSGRSWTRSASIVPRTLGLLVGRSGRVFLDKLFCDLAQEAVLMVIVAVAHPVFSLVLLRGLAPQSFSWHASSKTRDGNLFKGPLSTPTGHLFLPHPIPELLEGDEQVPWASLNLAIVEVCAQPDQHRKTSQGAGGLHWTSGRA